MAFLRTSWVAPQRPNTIFPIYRNCKSEGCTTNGGVFILTKISRKERQAVVIYQPFSRQSETVKNISTDIEFSGTAALRVGALITSVSLHCEPPSSRRLNSLFSTAGGIGEIRLEEVTPAVTKPHGILHYPILEGQTIVAPRNVNEFFGYKHLEPSIILYIYFKYT